MIMTPFSPAPLSVAGGAQPPGRLSIICVGQGQHPAAPRVATDIFKDVIEIEHQDGRWRTRGPSRLIATGFGIGWRPLYGVQIDPKSVYGVVRINFLSRAELRLDRSTGVVKVSTDAGTFSGLCDDSASEGQQ